MKPNIIPLILSLAVNSTVEAQCYSTGWQNPGTFSTDNSIGVYDYSIPGNTQQSDNSRSVASSLVSVLSGNTYYLKVSGFNFNIPWYASICGVTVEIESRATGLLLTASIRDHEVRLIKNGVITGNNYALAGNWGSSDSYKSYGGSTDTWGLVLNPADVNDPGFGIAISARITALIAALPSAEIDHIRMRLDYNPVLPVTLGYFNATRKKDEVLLEWQTMEEEDGAEITLETRMENGLWNVLQQFPMHFSTGYGYYSYTDRPRIRGLYQYRLKIKNQSGNIFYSGIRKISFEEGPAFRIYPNPASNYIITNLTGCLITDISGRKFSIPACNRNGETIFDIQALAPGIYMISNGKLAGKFVKE